MEAIAAEGGAPTKAQILAAAQSNPMAAEWRHLNKYLESIASGNSDEYIPIFDRAANVGSVTAANTGSVNTANVGSVSAANVGSVSAAPSSSSWVMSGHMQRAASAGALKQDAVYGMPGLLDLHGGRSDSSTPPFGEELSIVHPLAAPQGQAGAPANMLCGSTVVPFRLDPAAAAIPLRPAAYMHDAAYLFANAPAPLQQQQQQQPGSGSNVLRDNTAGPYQQNAANVFRSTGATPFSQHSAGNMPYTLP